MPDNRVSKQQTDQLPSIFYRHIQRDDRSLGQAASCTDRGRQLHPHLVTPVEYRLEAVYQMRAAGPRELIRASESTWPSLVVSSVVVLDRGGDGDQVEAETFGAAEAISLD